MRAVTAEATDSAKALRQKRKSNFHRLKTRREGIVAGAE